jgi:ATP-dependent Clp protease protease subunit
VETIKKYYALETNGKEADVYIFGDIVSWEWFENDVSSYTLAKELKELDPEVETINVHINSYGGEVAEGLAIYNTLRDHPAKVKTYCDGFACSAASVVFMAGDERIMSNASLLMIHNAWMCTMGDPEGLRKDADDLEKITHASINAYMDYINITEEKLKEMMDNETWIEPTEALEMGFATTITGESASQKAAASAKKALFNLVRASKANMEPEPEPIPEPEPEPEPEPPEPTPPALEPRQGPEDKLSNLLVALFR